MATTSETRTLQAFHNLYEYLLADERHLDAFKCGICEAVMRKVTMVTTCLHGFCEVCIRNVVNRAGVRKCPMCSVDLGDNPRESLRFDPLMTGLLEDAVRHHLRNRLRPEPEPDIMAFLSPPPETPPGPHTQASDAANGGQI